jgi:hypothetical protein
VLKPESVSAMLEPQPNAEGCGLAYGVGTYKGEKYLVHAGSNPGWNARFILAVNRREGFVIANNSSLGDSLNEAVRKIWAEVFLSRESASQAD